MKRFRWAIPLVIILFPLALWLLLIAGHNNFKYLPVIGPVSFDAKGDTVFHTLPSFSFVNQEGQIISDKTLSDDIFVANFFFASCKSVCPKMNEQVARVQNQTKDIHGLRLISFTVDPEDDSVPVLKKYAQKIGADSSRWWFLTGNKDSIYELARNGFLVPAAVENSKEDFFHSEDLILIDKQKRIRGIYDGTDQAEVDTLIDEIKVLNVEERNRERK